MLKLSDGSGSRFVMVRREEVEFIFQEEGNLIVQTRAHAIVLHNAKSPSENIPYEDILRALHGTLEGDSLAIQIRPTVNIAAAPKGGLITGI